MKFFVLCSLCQIVPGFEMQEAAAVHKCSVSQRQWGRMQQQLIYTVQLHTPAL